MYSDAKRLRSVSTVVKPMDEKSNQRLTSRSRNSYNYDGARFGYTKN